MRGYFLPKYLYFYLRTTFEHFLLSKSELNSIMRFNVDRGDFNLVKINIWFLASVVWLSGISVNHVVNYDLSEYLFQF